MRPLLASLGVAFILSLTSCATRAATGLSTAILTNFYPNHFIITPNAAPTEIIKIRGLGTNALDLLWANLFGTYTPTQPQNRLLANGITSANFLLSLGSLSVTPTTNAAVDINVNTNISGFQQGMVVIPSASAGGAAEIRLSAGNGDGNYLALQNGGPDGNGFILRNGSELYNAPGAFVHLPRGDWLTTNQYDTILLFGGANGWIELGRGNANTNVVTGDALWANTNLITWLKPVYGASVGWGAAVANGTIATATSDGLNVIHDASLGESDFNSLFIGAYDNATATTSIGWGNIFTGSGASAIAQLQLFTSTNVSSGRFGYFGVNLDPWSDVASIELDNNDGSTNFYVAPYSGYTSPGLRFLANDGTYWPQDTNTTAGLWIVDTNSVLQPTDLTWQPMVPSLLVGTNAFSYYGLANAGETLVGIRQISAGDPNYNSISLITSLTGNQQDASGLFNQEAYTNRTIFGMVVTENTIPSTFSVDVDNGLNLMKEEWIYRGDNVITIEPTVADGAGAIAYTYDTANALTDAAALVMAVRNATTNIFTIGPGAQVNFGEGGTNTLYRKGYSLVYSNSLSSGNPVEFQVANGNGALAHFGVGPAGNTYINSDVGQVTQIFGENQTANGLFVANGTLGRFGTMDLGNSTTTGSFRDLWLDRALYVEGFNTGADYSRLAISHGGTNDAIHLDSQSAGTAGDPRPIGIDFGGINRWAFAKEGTAISQGITKAQKTALTATNGMIVYQTDNTPGFRVYVNGAWYILSTAADP